MIENNVKVTDKSGIDVDYAKDISKASADFKSTVYLVSGDAIANAKSLLNILGAGIKGGANVKIVCDGEDETAAMDAVMKIFMEMKEN